MKNLHSDRDPSFVDFNYIFNRNKMNSKILVVFLFLVALFNVAISAPEEDAPEQPMGEFAIDISGGFFMLFFNFIYKLYNLQTLNPVQLQHLEDM